MTVLADAVSPQTPRFPEGPDGGELSALAGDFQGDPAAALERLVQQHGDVVGVAVPGNSLVIVNRPDLVRDVFLDLQHDTVKGVAQQRSRRLLGNGLLTSEGEDHSRARRLIAPAFHRPKLARYGEIIAACSESHVRSWSLSGVLDVHAWAAHLMLELVGRTLFGVDLTSSATDISDSLTTAIRWFARQNAFGPNPLDEHDETLVAALERLDAVVADLIATRRREEDTEAQHDDLLSALIAARDVDGSGDGLSDSEIRDHTMTLLLAGHETTANALAWTLGLLAANPAVQDRLRSDVRAAKASGSSATDLASTPFVRAVVSEGLRLFPPAWAMARRTTATVQLGQFTLPEGTTIVLSPWLLHHDSRWFDHPDRFEPERWLDGRTDAVPRGAFLPFGAGTRSCVGEHLAWLELGVAVAAVVDTCHLATNDRTSFAREHAITLRPRDGMWLTATAAPTP